MANIVQQTSKKNHVNRSGFDLSGNINFTACPGMLLPLRVDDCIPNSKYTFDYGVFARTIQMVVPSFARVKAHIDTFFVPYRLLGTDYPSVIVGDERGAISNYSNGVFSNGNKTFPYFRINNIITIDASKGNYSYKFKNSDAAGIKNSVSSPILLNALGYGVTSYPTSADGPLLPMSGATSIGSDGSLVSSFASDDSSNGALMSRSIVLLQAYQKIYQDYYRNKLWEKENKQAYFARPSDMSKEFSYSELENRGLCEMRYKDYDKDRLIGMIPNENNILSDGISQYASSVLVGSFGLDSPSVLGNSQNPVTNIKLLNSSLKSSSDSNIYGSPGAGVPAVVDNSHSVVRDSSNTLVQQYTAISNRRMEAFQKFAEITMLNKSDYKHQIKAHFGFTPSGLNSDYVSLVGSMDVPLNISDVENTSDSNQGYLAGKGTVSGGSKRFTVDVNEHGIIMSIFYILPQIDWSNLFIDRATLRFNRFDFAIPEFDRLGFEPIRVLDVFGNFVPLDKEVGATDVLGYLPRYWYYKTRLDINTTGFSSSSKKDLNFDAYVVQYDFNRIIDGYENGTMYKAFKSLPTDLNSMFAVDWSQVSDNQFIFSCYIQCKAQIPLSIDSLPY